MSHKSEPKPLLDAAIRFDNLKTLGRHIEIKPDAAQRQAIAERLQVDDLKVFTAKLHALPIKGGVQVKGSLTAVVTQPCVITFVPVDEKIEEDFARIFLLGNEEEETAQAGAEVFIDLEGEDLPDYFEGPEVDFTELLLETLALAVNPYPKAPGAEIPDSAKSPIEETSPFASLKHLKSSGD